MPRKTKIVTINQDGRDKGRRYLITEMSGSQGERWASRALSALAKSNPDMAEMKASGMAGIAALGLKVLLTIAWEDAEPLLDEMFATVAFIPDQSRPDVIRPLIEDDVEEVQTRVALRGEIIELHTGFSVNAALSKMAAAFKTVLSSQTTPTSPPASA